MFFTSMHSHVAFKLFPLENSKAQNEHVNVFSPVCARSCIFMRLALESVFLQYEQINVLHQCTLPCMYPNYLLEWMYLIILPNTRNVCNMTPKLKPFYKMAETPTLGVLKAPKHEEWVTDIFAHTGRVNLRVYAGIDTSGGNWHHRKSVCNRRTR